LKTESRFKPYDVLIHLITLAVGEGFNSTQLYNEVKSTFAYSTLMRRMAVDYQIYSYRRKTLYAYDEYNKVRLMTKHIKLRIEERLCATKWV
jgi:ATP-dependent Lhr-like helicase